MQESLEKKYKDSLNLPKTSFPMKGNLLQKEPEIINFWDKNYIYQKMLEKNNQENNFTLPDGPPYANGNLHMGHVLNKTLKDIIIKYKNMQGYYSAFIPGWDCHGLPIEHKVTKNLGSKKNTCSDTEIRNLCRKEALNWVNRQQSQFIRIGILADWENRYLTMQAYYEAEEVRQFAHAYKKGLIYKGEKPVYWCWALQTALAEAEVEYHEHKSPSIYVKFYIKENDPKKNKHPVLKDINKPISFVIWTTTPWTLPANVAISLHPDFTYCLYQYENGNKDKNEYVIIAKDLKENFQNDTKIILKETSHKTLTGKELEFINTDHPFIKRNSVIVCGEHVTKEAGTGCVHTAPGHGQEDYQIGLKYNLPVISPVNEFGKFTKEVPEYENILVFDANEKIIEKLQNSNHLISRKNITHQYPHCWRSKTPLIFRTTPQWFLGLDLPQNNLRKKLLQSIEKIKYYPQWGQQRLKSMIENRPDWCLSRQRIWGVPIPIFYCKKTNEPLVEFNIMMKIADIMENNNGIESFWEINISQILEELNIKFNGEFGSEGFIHGKDILDVWFDSGICHSAVQIKNSKLKFPADIYLEGSDQHRGWFNTSLISSIAVHDQAPFESLITHGFVNDSKGKKMSKSLGNVIEPEKIIKQYGAEILRLWVSCEDYSQDLSCGIEDFRRISESYRKFRNNIRFILGNLYDFNITTEVVEYEKLLPIDKWALIKLNQLIQDIQKSYDEYAFYKVYHLLNNFFTVILSATYLDILKDRLYTWKNNCLGRRSAQTTLYYIIERILKMIAPILSFLAEEAYKELNIPNENKESSIFLTSFPKSELKWNNQKIEKDFIYLLKIREMINKQLEIARNQKIIGSSLEAQIKITTNISENFEILNKYQQYLPEIFIVSQVKIALNKNSNKLNLDNINANNNNNNNNNKDENIENIEISKAEGEKCIRCWNYSLETNQNEEYPAICPKCIEALI